MVVIKYNTAMIHCLDHSRLAARAGCWPERDAVTMWRDSADVVRSIQQADTLSGVRRMLRIQRRDRPRTR